MRLAICLLLAGCGSAKAPAEAGKPVSSAPPSAMWFKAEVYCPPGTRYEGTVCKPLVVLDCPAGTHFKEGVGCIGRVVEEPKPPASAPAAQQDACACREGDLACRMRCQQRMPKFEPPPAAVPQGKDPFGPPN